MKKEKLEKEMEEVKKQREELQSLISKEEEKIQTSKKTSERRKDAKEEEMEDWCSGMLNLRDDEGGILAFSYQGRHYAIKDGEQVPEIPLRVAEHISHLSYKVMGWEHEGRDTYEGQQGVKKIMATRTRGTFKIFEKFKRPKGYRPKKVA